MPLIIGKQTNPQGMLYLKNTLKRLILIYIIFKIIFLTGRNQLVHKQYNVQPFHSMLILL